jgi:hypothetical protein
MARQAVVRCALLLVTTDAEAHRVIDHPFRHSHRCEIAMAHGTIHAGADMRRMIESNMRFFHEPIHALPGQLFPALCMIAQRLNSRVIRVTKFFMTRHAKADARNAGPRTAVHAGVTLVAFDSDLIELVNLVREVDRLLRFGSDAQEMFGRVAEAGMRRGKGRSGPPLRPIRVCRPAGISRYIRLLDAPKHNNGRYEQYRCPDALVTFAGFVLHCSRKNSARSYRV